jgi:hypothetical protein
MTKDDIMKLALESGFAKILDEHASEYRDFTFKLSEYPELLAFVNLVAGVEREACAKLCDDLDDDIVDGLAGWQFGEAIRARGTK